MDEGVRLMNLGLGTCSASETFPNIVDTVGPVKYWISAISCTYFTLIVCHFIPDAICFLLKHT